MAKTKIVLNNKGVGELLKSTEMQQMLNRLSGEIATRADGEAEVYTAETRSVGCISVTSTSENMDNNTLLKALR